MQWQQIGLGSRVRVFGQPGNPIVVKKLRPPAEIAAQFKQWGMILGEQSWSPYPGDTAKTAQFLFESSYKSCQLAWDKVREETGLVSLDFDEQDLVRAFDEPRKSIFVQKRVELLGDRLEAANRANDEALLDRMLHDFVDHVRGMWHQGISENTFDFWTNYGYPFQDEERLILVDIGELFASPGTIEDQVANLSQHNSWSLRKALAPRMPAFAEKWKEAIDALIAEFSKPTQGSTEATRLSRT